MYCKQCGKEIGEAKFCPYCGASQEVAPQQQVEQPGMDQGGYQPINDQPNYQQNYARTDDAPNMGFMILSFFIPIVGLVLFCVWNKDYPQKAKSCLKGFIGSIVFYVVMVCCLVASAMSVADKYDNDFYTESFFNAIVETVPYE